MAAVQKGGEVEGWGAALQLDSTGITHPAELLEALPVLPQSGRVQRPNGLG